MANGDKLYVTLLTLLVILPTPTFEREYSDEECPKGCVCQEPQVYCSGFSLLKVPSSLPHYAETLHLQHNSIRKLHYKQLAGLRRLRHVSFKSNQISRIDTNAFKDLTALISLSLSENKVRAIKPNTLDTLQDLRVLSLRDNKVKTIDNILSKLSKLVLLNVANNRLRKITHRTFRFNWRLQIIDLHNNNIRAVHRYAFRGLPHLKFLVLRDNPIHALELDFRENFHLELLDLSNCRLQEMMKGLPFSIRDLRLSDNKIKKLEAKDFASTKKIRLLVLNNNRIRDVSDDALADLWHLHSLYIGKNRLRQLPSNLPLSTEAVYANFNNITELSLQSLWRATELRVLAVRHNDIQDVHPGVLQNLVHLQDLDVSHNRIKNMRPYTFQRNTDLQKLDISNNPIQTMGHHSLHGLNNLHIFQMASVGTDQLQTYIQPSVLTDLPNVLFLDLSNTSQVAVHMIRDPDVLDHIQKVKDLSLMYDELYGLPSDFPNHFPELRTIKLVGNPWHCDRHILWLAHWMRNRTVEFFAPYHMRCLSPPDLHGVLIMDLTEIDVRDSPELHTDDKSQFETVKISFKHITPNGTMTGTTGQLLNATRIPLALTKTRNMEGQPHATRAFSVPPLFEIHGSSAAAYSRPPDYVLKQTTSRTRATRFTLDYVTDEETTTLRGPPEQMPESEDATYNSYMQENASIKKGKRKKKKKKLH